MRVALYVILIAGLVGWSYVYYRLHKWRARLVPWPPSHHELSPEHESAMGAGVLTVIGFTLWLLVLGVLWLLS